MKVKFKKLHEDAKLPAYATPGAAAFDLVASENIIVYGGQTQLVKTGLAVEIPPGFEMQIRPRSGMSLKTTLRIPNSPGTIDSDFRGEICVIMHNTALPEGDWTAFVISKGDRIAQGAICPVIQAEMEFVDELSSTDRGAGGFGSSGK
jgi:dUTP pyrophosphatase